MTGRAPYLVADRGISSFGRAGDLASAWPCQSLHRSPAFQQALLPWAVALALSWVSDCMARSICLALFLGLVRGHSPLSDRRDHGRDGNFPAVR